MVTDASIIVRHTKRAFTRSRARLPSKGITRPRRKRHSSAPPVALEEAAAPRANRELWREENVGGADETRLRRATMRRRREIHVAARAGPVVVALDGDSDREHDVAFCHARASMQEDVPVIVLDSDDETKMEDRHSALQERGADVIVIDSEGEEQLPLNREEARTIRVDDEKHRVMNFGNDDELAIDRSRRARPLSNISALLRRHGLHVAHRSSSGSPTYLVCKFCLLRWPRRARSCTMHKAELFAPPFREAEVRRHMWSVHRELYKGFVKTVGVGRERIFKGLVIPTKDKLAELVKQKVGEREREEERREEERVRKKKAEWCETREERNAKLDVAEREGEEVDVQVVLRNTRDTRKTWKATKKVNKKERKKNWWKYVRGLGL